MKVAKDEKGGQVDIYSFTHVMCFYVSDSAGITCFMKGRKEN